MTIEVALKILELNVICSPRATEFKEAVEVITKELKYQNEVSEKKQTEYNILRKSAVSWMNKCNKLQAEVEKMKKANESFSCMGKFYSEIKSEVIKEHKEKVENALISKGFHPAMVRKALEEIEQEMTE